MYFSVLFEMQLIFPFFTSLSFHKPVCVIYLIHQSTLPMVCKKRGGFRNHAGCGKLQAPWLFCVNGQLEVAFVLGCPAVLSGYMSMVTHPIAAKHLTADVTACGGTERPQVDVCYLDIVWVSEHSTVAPSSKYTESRCACHYIPNLGKSEFGLLLVTGSYSNPNFVHSLPKMTLNYLIILIMYQTVSKS